MARCCAHAKETGFWVPEYFLRNLLVFAPKSNLSVLGPQRGTKFPDIKYRLKYLSPFCAAALNLELWCSFEAKGPCFSVV